MKRSILMVLILTAIFFGVAVIIGVALPDPQNDVLFSVLVPSEDETELIDCWKSEKDEYYIFLPSYADLSRVQIRLNTESPLSIDGITMTDGYSCKDFQLNVPYEMSYVNWGKTFTRTITFMQSDNIATMYITTKSGNMDYIHSQKGNEESGTISLYTSEGNLDYTGDLESINGRGNYTWEAFDKKPYSLKLSREAGLLEMGQAQKWILLANADDTSHLRNKIVYDFADAVGLDFSPESKWVDLYLNNEYAGIYLLCERNEVHPERVYIAENGSYLVSIELEERLVAQNYTYVSTSSGQALRVHYPLTASAETLSVLTQTLQCAENAILSEDGIDPVTRKAWNELIDLDSWVRKFLIEELFGNHDHISQYFYYDSNDKKIYAGPVWDYDHSIGTKASWQLASPNVFQANRLKVNARDSAPWFHYLYQKDEFYDRMVDLYQSEFQPLLEKMLTQGINEYTTQIASASSMDQIRWDNEEESVAAQAEYIVHYMNARLAFLSKIWVDGVSYHVVEADQSIGTDYAHYVIYDGEYLTDLPQFADTENSIFLGWYYAGTHEPFDPTRPITEDIEIYAKWEDSISNKINNIIKLIPLGLIVVMFIALFVVDVIRMKREKVTKDGRI